MPLDHYVSQVHLKNFYSPALGNRTYAIRKADLKAFTPRAEDVCRIEDGSTNAYLKRNRAIEDFLRTIEPRYNRALAKLRQDRPDKESIYAVAGFVAYITSCSPTAMRLGIKPLQSVLHSTSEILDRRGVFTRAPEALGSKSMTELLNDGTIHFVIDQKYPQALGIDGVIHQLSVFGNSRWELLRNADPANPFFTSDFPASIEARGNTGIVNRIVPLAPDLAVRILPDVKLSRAKPDLSFAGFRFRSIELDRMACAEVNRSIVRCAEELVFYRDNADWIEAFVRKNRGYRIETEVTRLPFGNGLVTVASQAASQTQRRGLRPSLYGTCCHGLRENHRANLRASRE